MLRWHSFSASLISASVMSEGKTAWDVAERYISVANNEAYDVLKLIKPDYLVRATDYIQQQIDFAKGLDLAESTPDITDDLKRLIIQRRQARAEKNWEESDRIRDELLQAGVAVRDTPSGSVWTWK
jgi:cysteinyl-tRNA synthetase